MRRTLGGPRDRVATSRVVMRGAAWVVCALSLASPSCGKADAGVHATVSVDLAAFSSAQVFDHITVTAKGGSKHATICLFLSQSPRQLEATSSATDPCADLVTGPPSTAPTAAAWASTMPRTINFVFSAGDGVAVDASAALGASLSVASAATATATAGASYPSVALVLEPTRGTLDPSCALTLGAPVVSAAPPLCKATLTACPLDSEASLRTSAMSCVGDTSRVQSDGMVSCPNAAAAARAVWRSAPNWQAPSGTCVSVAVTGRFARCASGSASDPGGCPLTTDCVTPPTQIALFSTALPLQTFDISCLPPSTAPVSFSVPFQNRHDGPDNTAEEWAAIVQDAGDPARGCFFDVWSVDLVSAQSLPCSRP